MQVRHHYIFVDNEQYSNRNFATAKPANDNEYQVTQAQQVEQRRDAHLTEFEWARQTSKTWDMGQD